MISGKGEKRILCAPHRAMKSKSEQVCFFAQSDDIHYKKTDSAVALADAFGGKGGGGGGVSFSSTNKSWALHTCWRMFHVLYIGWLVGVVM